MVIYITITIFFGILVTIHVAMNARVGTLIGSPASANFIFWLVGAVTSGAAICFHPKGIALGGLIKVPPQFFLAGMIGCCLALFNNWIIPRIGIAPFTLLIILGQLCASAYLSGTGIFGTAMEALTLPRIVGLVLVATGAGIYLFIK